MPAIASFIAFRSLLSLFGQCVLSRLLFSQKHHGSHHQKQFGCYLVLLVQWLRAWVCHLYILQLMCKPECIEPLVHADNHAAFARVYCSCCASHPLCLEYRFSLTDLAILPMVYTLLKSIHCCVVCTFAHCSIFQEQFVEGGGGGAGFYQIPAKSVPRIVCFFHSSILWFPVFSRVHGTFIGQLLFIWALGSQIHQGG